MGKCNIDHSHQDVVEKLNSQKDYLPDDLFAETEGYLKKDVSQENLNELFHLLKKYDLASPDEKTGRDKKLSALVNQ